jgi:hypothetical protein
MTKDVIDLNQHKLVSILNKLSSDDLAYNTTYWCGNSTDMRSSDAAHRRADAWCVRANAMRSGAPCCRHRSSNAVRGARADAWCAIAAGVDTGSSLGSRS